MADKVTNVGLGIVTNRIKGVGIAEPAYVAMGTGVTTAAVTDTVIQTEVETRTLGTSSQQTSAAPAVTNDTYRVVGTVTATATRAIANAGLLTASTSGSLFVHSDFAVINLAANDSITFTFNILFTTS
jgi:hypothetical protein